MIFTRNRLLAWICSDPLGNSQHLPNSVAGCGERTLGWEGTYVEGWKGEGGKKKTENGNGRREKVPYRHFFFPTSSPDSDQ